MVRYIPTMHSSWDYICICSLCVPSQAQQKTLREREHTAPAYDCCILHSVALAFETTCAQSLHYDVLCAAVAKDVQDQAGLGQEGQAEPTYSSVDQV